MALTAEQKKLCKREGCRHAHAAHKGGKCRMRHCKCEGFKSGGFFS